ncbi:MAG: hypothetical protein WKF95_18740 [Rubrobacter sp.]
MANRGFLGTTVTVAALAAAVATLVFLTVEAGPAEASFPGQNGKMAFVRSNDVWTMNPDGSGQTNLTNTPDVWETNPAFSPDGTKLVFQGSLPNTQGVGVYEIYTVNADGTDLRRLTYNDRSDSGPAWSPNGDKIVCFSGGHSDRALRTMDADGTDEETLVADVDYVGGNPAWSPDGSRIAFVSYEEEGAYDDKGYDLTESVSVVDADGSDPTRIAGPYYEVDDRPTWSPDGDRVAFRVTDGPDGDSEVFANSIVDIHVADTDGSGAPRLVRTKEIGETYPA